MKSIKELVKQKPWTGWLLFTLTVILVFLLGLLASSIVERRGESAALQLVRPIGEWEPRNEVWGVNYPRQYHTYLMTQDTTFYTKYGGNGHIDLLEKYPSLVILWAGYAFSRDYSQARGHYYSVIDVRKTLRTGVPQPATCWTCKSTDVPRLMNEMGIANFYKAKLTGLGSQVLNPIGCQDCHDPKTMNLRITRPALIEAFQRQGKDINKATHNEMRSLVCAQCHVEYYFKGEGKYLVFPWDNGISVEEMEKYYDEIEHTDFIHALSKVPIVKAQHPDWELAQFGIHAQRGISCADCHMPYKSEGGIKFTSHHVVSPLKNIEGSCQVCHRESEETLRKNVYERQDKIRELLDIVENSLVKAHLEAKVAWDNGAKEGDMKSILKLIRQAQWRWDYVSASIGGAFHAPLECARILGKAIQKSEQSRNELTKLLIKLNVKLPINYPDISTKEKAQKYIGLDMNKLFKEKEEFIKSVVADWDKKSTSKY